MDLGGGDGPPGRQRPPRGVQYMRPPEKQFPISNRGGEFSAPLTELHDARWNRIACAMA